MNRCSYCGKRASFIRLLSMSRAFPYRCSTCSQISKLNPRHNTIAALLTLLAVLVSAFAILPCWGYIFAIAAFFVMYFGVGAIMLLFMQLVPYQPNE
jgi:DNA-directed RNA polymerase subunit RPC12/RpoP